MTTRAEVVAEARSWISTPWVHQHRTKGIAVDCAGLVIGVARSLGLVPADFDVPAYKRQPNGTMIDLCAAHMTRVDQAQMQPGDVLIVAVDMDPQHMGIVGDYAHGGLSLIHAASTGQRGVVETRLMFARNLRFKAAFALPGVH
jgi:cell wall-associated NlpC family hydrolase